ncbi:DUF6090 family protein [Gaetbulibacter sp. M240]|uniref:DUF6090 family protein n=1 Tax=Gaetbulibacter sp. M240 TaxID=3126511 RepID=UPI00374EC043
MIKFFRRFRKDLIQKNKISQYLKYAIGEIILVVIGILIALQFNTWRVEKNDRHIEKILLKNIKMDLESDIQELKGVRAFKTSQNKAALRLLEYLIDTSKPLEDTVQFVNDFNLMIYFTVPSPNRTSFDIATSTGYLNNITNDRLNKELSNYYANIGLEQHVTETKRFINAFNDTYLINKYRIFNNLVMALDGQGGDYALERYKDDNRPVIQLQDIRGDVSLENYLNNLSIRLEIGIIGLEREESWALRLVGDIEEELNLKN